MVEGIKRTEKSGFSVDGIATDGAKINRKVWKIRNIKEGVHYCVHPCDISRKLFLYSDHSYLIKCFRNCIMQYKTFWVRITDLYSFYEALLCIRLISYILDCMLS